MALEDVDIGKVGAFSTACVRFALGEPHYTEKYGPGFWPVSFIVSHDFGDGLKEAIVKKVPVRHLHFGEYPILVSLLDQKLYFYRGFPLWGGAIYQEQAGFIDANLTP